MKSIYIHIPFCVSKCLYCDFYSSPKFLGLAESYVDSLVKHIKSEDIRDTKTVFIGGGTPTCLSEEGLYKIMEALSASKPAEFTVEANPGTVTKEKLRILKDGGVTRISIGMQAAQDRLLKIIGRSHTHKDFLEAVELAKEFDFEINADAMLGLPSQTEGEWLETLNCITSLEIPHASCYSLTIAENTPFGKELPCPLPDEETERRMYKTAKELLGASGMNRYEISNYAKEGHECLHNLLCWHGEEYKAFGSGAHGYENGIRYCYEDDIKGYITKPEKVVIEKLSERDRISELCILSLRLATGIDEAEFFEKFGINVYELYKNVIDKYVAGNLLCRKEGHIYLTEHGLNFANTVMSDFLL